MPGDFLYDALSRWMRAQQLQNIIKAKLLPEVERQRGLLNDQMSKNPQLMQMGRGQPMAPRAATQRDVRMQGLLR